MADCRRMMTDALTWLSFYQQLKKILSAPRVCAPRFPPFSCPSSIHHPRSDPTMTGKAKPKKHTAKELAAKLDAATTNCGGGKEALADRTGKEKGGHAKYECPHRKITIPDLKTMEIHHESKHQKVPCDEPKLNNLHAILVAESSKGCPGVRGSLKK